MATVGGNSSEEILLPKFPFVCREIQRPHLPGTFYGEGPLGHLFRVMILEIFFFNLCAQFIHFLLKPLRQPKVVSEILAAILIGPSVLGERIGFTDSLFPDNAKYVIKNVGTLGFMFFIFIAGVQMDLSLIKNAGRENTYIALTGVIAPMIAAISVGVFFTPLMAKGSKRVDTVGAIATYVVSTSSAVIHFILKELNLLSSEMGRKALTITILGDVVGISVVLVHEAVQLGKQSFRGTFIYILSLIVVAAFLLICVRRVMFWIINNTPNEKPVRQLYVVLSLLSVMVMGFITDMLGLAISRGSLWFGLVIPSGPPLGTAIVERSRAIIMDVIMPFSYLLIGLRVDISVVAAYSWHGLLPVFTMVAVGYITKFVATFLVACHFGVQWKDSLALSLILNMRGQTELFILVRWMQKKIIGIRMFSTLVILLLFITSISTYFLTALYDPMTPYLVTRRRTVQHTPPGSELMVVVCVPDEGSVPGLINLIEISNPAPQTPVMVYAIHLIELIGLSIPHLIDHEEQPEGKSPLLHDEHTEKIYNVLKSYEERNDYVAVHLFTAMSPKRTMYQDICYLALIKITALIIIPLNKDETEHGYGSGLYRDGKGMQSVNEKVLTHSPCSVAIFVRQGNDQKPATHQSFNRSQQIVTLLFLGGADAREALAYADRMVANPNVILKVIKFTPTEDDGDSIERKLDDEMLRWFWKRNISNERVLCSEVLSKNGEDTIAAIHELAEGKVDLWIVGRKQGINPILLAGLLDWVDQNDKELGIIGEFLASDDFSSEGSVLVFHQQILRGKQQAMSS